MNRIRIDYDIAHSVGRDIGNRLMRKAGRTKWNRDDFNEATPIMNELLDGGTHEQRRNRT